MNLKMAAEIVGLVLAVVGIVINNWKVATIGNALAVFSLVFL